MPKNRVKQIYESGKVAFGTNVAIPSPIVVEVATNATAAQDLRDRSAT